MKHLKILLAGLLALLLLAACGGDGGGAAQSADPSVPPASEPASAPGSSSDPAPAGTDLPVEERGYPQAPDITLTDQNGVEHTLSDYQGQVVFLNFWATWCGPCRDEMPDIQQIYLDHEENAGDVVVLGVALPAGEENMNTSEGSAEEVAAFLAENGYTYPTLMDRSGAVFGEWGISAFPTTFLINAEGLVVSYIPGSVGRDVMDAHIQFALDSVPE